MCFLTLTYLIQIPQVSSRSSSALLCGDDNYKHACTEDNPVALYWFISTIGFGVIVGASYYLYSICKNYCSGVTSLEDPLIGDAIV